MAERLRVLAVDDDAAALAFVTLALGGDHDLHTVGEGGRAIEALDRAVWDVLLVDLNMPAPDGFEVLRAAQRAESPPAVIVVSALDRSRSTLEALRLGAHDYLVKPACAAELRSAVERLGGLTRPPDSAAREDWGLLGEAASMRRLRRLVPLLARSREPVLVSGETGVGKELVAQALHAASGCTGSFVAHNMAATPPELAESLFFGHVRGAFTGATGDHAGLFEQASGGTLFLDEIDSFPLSLQAKLLRALETGRVHPVGGAATIVVAPRVVAACSSNLAERVARSEFRADLYYRLRQLEVTIPPLRERAEDVPLLARRFLHEFATETGRRPQWTDAALAALATHPWPGNVRELRGAVRSAALLADGGPIRVAHLPRDVAGGAAGTLAWRPIASLDVMEREHIQRVLDRTGGNRSRAAKLLGIDRGTLARKLEREAGAKPD